MGDMEQWKEPAQGLTSEDIWAMFRETDRQMRETDREGKETCRFLEGLIAKTDEQIKKTDKQTGELGNRFGELAEHLVVAGQSGDTVRIEVPESFKPRIW
jgi:hypothetical protein